MAMLAEPKRKQKYGPDPRNTFWSSDENKFGFRMLENMGWKKGKGLGAKESGMTEHIKVDNRKTTNVRGFGCSKKDAERWIAHQDDFDSILASFNDSPDTSDASGKLAEDTNSSHALEEKSKSSRSRMHYHKFMRSKDLSSRSSHDLNCIFGRRKGKSSEDSTPAAQSEVNGDENSSSDDQAKNSNNNNNNDNDATHGVKTITSSTSVQEYFAMKMAELQRKRGATAGDGCLDKGDENVDISTENNNKDDDKDPDTAAQAVNNESRSAADASSVSAGEDCGVVEKPKRKKKKKKDRQEDEKNDVEQEAHLGEDSLELRASSAENCQESSSCVEQQPAKSKKKGKRKRKADSSECGLDTSTQAISAEEPESEISQEVGPTTKKRNKRKSAEQSLSASEQEETCEVTNDVSEEHCEEPRRKKKKKKKQKKDETESHNSSILRQENDGKSRRRKSVQFSANEVEIFLIPNKEDAKAEQESEETMTKKLSKKRKRQKTQAAEETKSTNDETSSAESTPGEMEDPLKEDNDDDDEPKKKKRKTEAKVSKKKSKTQKKEEDIQGQSAENESPHSESADGGDDEVNTSNPEEPESPASDRIPEAVASKPKKKVSRERLNGICQAFVGSSLSSVAGYGNSL